MWPPLRLSRLTACLPRLPPCSPPQAITKAGYQQPTAIQAQALPAALSGRDVLVGAGAAGLGMAAADLGPSCGMQKA